VKIGPVDSEIALLNLKKKLRKGKHIARSASMPSRQKISPADPEMIGFIAIFKKLLKVKYRPIALLASLPSKLKTN